VTTTRSTLTLLPGRFGILRLDPATPIPSWVWNGVFSSVSRTPTELSIVCEEPFIPQDVKADRGWCAFVVAGPMDLSTVGVLASIAGALAAAQVALFAVSTFETDYVLVKEETTDLAVKALRDYGHIVME
jgi:hypothetical protein